VSVCLLLLNLALAGTEGMAAPDAPVEAATRPPPALDAPALPPALAAPALAPAEPVPEPRGAFVGDSWRYRQREPFLAWLGHFALRTLADVVAVPASVVRWEGPDYLTFGLAVAIPVGFSAGVNGRSLDSRITITIHALRGGPNCGYAQANSAFCPAPETPPRFWTLLSDDIIMASLMGIPALMLGISALVKDAEPFVEVSALALEALVVTQVYHLGLKFLTGREGPLARDGRGEYFGPTRINFPDGTPSGHSATMFAIAGVYAFYFDSVILKVGLLGAAGIAATFLVIDDSHFASEVIVGSAMGLLIARWVVEHRSSLYRYGKGGLPVRLAGVAPMAVVGAGAGLAATFRF
jgi:membrane-associated phospholipid phosphatase